MAQRAQQPVQYASPWSNPYQQPIPQLQQWSGPPAAGQQAPFAQTAPQPGPFAGSARSAAFGPQQGGGQLSQPPGQLSQPQAQQSVSQPQAQQSGGQSVPLQPQQPQFWPTTGSQQFQQQGQPSFAGTAQQGQPSFGGGSPAGGQSQTGQSQMLLGSHQGQGFEQSVPNEVAALTSQLDRLETITQWAGNRAASRGQGDLARICSDVEDVAHVQKQLTVRLSPAAKSIGRSTADVIQNAIQELQPYMDDPEVQETVSAAQQAVTSINDALARLPGPGAAREQGQPFQQMWP